VVLATLLLEPNAWVPIDRLAEAVWPEADAPVSAVANLKTYVWRLRGLLPDGAARIERRADAYRIRVGPGELDADQAVRLGEQARSAAAGGDPVTALALVEQALGLWRGRPFSGIGTAAADEAAARLDEHRVNLRADLAGLQLASGRCEDAVATLELVTAAAPLREAAWAQLVRTLHGTGRRAEALAAYRRAGELLRSELGVEPGPDLSAAYGVALGGSRPARTRRELPADVALVGRTREQAALRRAAPVTLVTGMAGVGKTALAVHVAHRIAAEHADGQFFVDLHGSDRGGPLRPADVLDRLLRRLGVATADVPPGLDDRAALWRSETAGRRILLVLDDASDADQVRPLLPAAPTCRTLITTRHRGWHPAGAGRVTLEPLDNAAAAALFAGAAGTPGAGGYEVVRHCGGLPAALLDAAARLRTRPQWTARRLAADLAEDPCRVLHDACRRLDGRELAAWRALGVLPARFDTAAAARVLGVAPAAASRDLETLVDRGLLDAATPDAYRSHPLIRHLAGCGTPVVRPLTDRRRAA
jgi:DNA-binding SARP family transcriptional activator